MANDTENISMDNGAYNHQNYYNNKRAMNEDNKENVLTAAKKFRGEDFVSDIIEQPSTSNAFPGFVNYIDNNIGNYNNNAMNDLATTFAPMSTAIQPNWQQHYGSMMYTTQSAFGPPADVGSSPSPASTCGYQDYEHIEELGVPAEQQQQNNFNNVTVQQHQPQEQALEDVHGTTILPPVMVDYRLETSVYQPLPNYDYNLHNLPLMHMYNSGDALTFMGNFSSAAFQPQQDAGVYHQSVIPVKVLPQEMYDYSHGSSGGDSGVGATTDQSYGSGSADGQTSAEIKPFNAGRRPQMVQLVMGELENDRMETLNKIMHREMTNASFPQQMNINGNPYDVYCPVPGRMSLLSAAKTYDVTIGEISRRISPPEVLNASCLNSILRKWEFASVPAKNKNGSTTMRTQFKRYGLQVPPGRRKSAEPSKFSTMSEGEAIQMTNDFGMLVGTCYSARALSKVLVADLKDDEVFMLVHMRRMLFDLSCHIDEIEFEASLMRSAVDHESKDYYGIREMFYAGVLRCSRLTHGFGNRATIIGVNLQLDILKCIIEIIEENVTASRYPPKEMEMALELIQEQKKLDVEMEVERKRRVISKGVRLAEERRFFEELAERTGMTIKGPIFSADPESLMGEAYKIVPEEPNC